MEIKARNKVNPNFNMSSMTDIVFLLLIFFIITSSFVAPHAIDLLLPQGRGQVIKGLDEATISITHSGKYYLGKKEISSNQVESSLINRFEKSPAKEKTLTIRAEQGVPIEKVVAVLSVAKKHKYKTVLATRPIQ